MRTLLCHLIVGLWVLVANPERLPAQEPVPEHAQRQLTVFAAAVAQPVLQHRLLPAEYELRDGNAAPILLRLPWEQTQFLMTDVSVFHEHLEIPLSEPGKIITAGPGLRPRMYAELRRAAFRRTAAWEYPIDESPADEIILPDVQGSRQLVFGGLAVWIRLQIAQKRLDEARQGILVGLANARHYARSPFLISQLVAAAHSNVVLDRLEELIQQPGCPNFYWPLTALPSPFIDFRRGFEFNRGMLEKSVVGLHDLEQARSPEQWDALAHPLIKKLLDDSIPNDERALEAIHARALGLARRELPKLRPEVQESIPALCDGELIVRWFMARIDDLYDRMTGACGLTPSQAVAELCRIESEASELTNANSLRLVMQDPSTAYLELVRFDRRVASLRVVEALRHYAATHQGKLPEKLAEMTGTPVPRDPYTGEPFGYKRQSASVVITAPGIADAGGTQHNAVELRIKFVQE